MAKGQNLSSYQRGIVNRYYENRDTIALNKLSEMVSELYLAEGKKADTLWKRVQTALANTKASQEKVSAIIAKRDLEGLAKLIGELT